MVGEQVSHHPPVSAFHAEGQRWVVHGAVQPRLKFWGKSIEIEPRGSITLQLLELVNHFYTLWDIRYFGLFDFPLVIFERVNMLKCIDIIRYFSFLLCA